MAEYESIKDKALEQSLMTDVAKSEAASRAGAEARGATGEAVPERFGISAVRIGKKKILEKELSDYDLAVNKLVDQLTNEAGLIGGVEQDRFRRAIQTRFGQYKTEMIKRSQAFEMELNKRKMDEAKKQKLRQFLGQAAESMGMMGGLALAGKSGKEGKYDSSGRRFMEDDEFKTGFTPGTPRSSATKTGSWSDYGVRPSRSDYSFDLEED